MAGNWHHFITQKLQSGFATPGNKKVMLTWEVHRSRPILPVPRPTRDIGAADRFDAHGDLTADIAITEAERLYHPLLDKLRMDKKIHLEDNGVALKMLANFYSRTENFRQAIVSFKQAVRQGVERWARNPLNILMYTIEFGKKHPEKFRELAQHFQYPIDPDYLDVLLMLGPDHLEALVAPYANLPPVDDELLAKIDVGMKVILLESFVEDPSPANLQEMLKGFHLSVEEWEDGQLVLGDGPVVFKTVGGTYTNLARDNDSESIELAILPISSTLALVAKRRSSTPTPPWSEIRLASVTCSMKFFISKERNTEVEALQAKIGSTLFEFPEKEINEMISDVINNVDTDDFDSDWEKTFKIIMG